MAAPDYREDLFQHIKSIHFGGGQWMYLAAAIPSITGSVTVKVTLPDQSGGTPGWTLWLAKVPAPYPVGPRNITAALLKGRVQTDAGASFTGFNERVNVGGAPPSGRDYVRIWIKLDKEMPTSPFRVRMDIVFTGGLGTKASLQVATVQKGKMKAGLNTNAVPIGSLGEVLTGSNTGSPFDFRVNPSTLAVIAPPSP